ncbi:MAG: hypothetical protein V7K97_26355 [Nostoc sp.]
MMHLNVNILAEIGAIASVGMIDTILCSEWRLHSEGMQTIRTIA